jgi:hypothetical protein
MKVTPVKVRDHRPIRVSEHPEKEALERLASAVCRRNGCTRVKLRGAFKDFEAQHATQE